MAIVGSLFAGLVTRELGGAVMSRGLRESRAEKGVARFCFFLSAQQTWRRHGLCFWVDNLMRPERGDDDLSHASCGAGPRVRRQRARPADNYAAHSNPPSRSTGQKTGYNLRTRRKALT